MKKKLKFKFNKQESHSQSLERKPNVLASDENQIPIKHEAAINCEPPQPIGYMAMATLKEIDAQIAALQVQRGEVRKNELKSAIEKVRNLVAEYGLTQADVFASARGARSSTAGAKVAPKYRDPATGGFVA